MFEQSLVTAGNTRASSLAVSLGSQAVLVGFGLLAPLIYFQQLGAVEFKATSIQAPPMTPPAPPLTKILEQAQRSFARATSVFIMPTRVPERVNDRIIDEAPGIPIPGLSVPTGFPSTGTGDLMIGNNAPPPEPVAAKPPEAVKPKQTGPHRVGGAVMAAKLIHQVKPVYPPLAISSRTQGTVKLTAVIGRDGTIQNLQLISGHPLLVQAALIAVKQWRYSPTLLNQEPVDVLTQIDVNFVLGQ